MNIHSQEVKDDLQRRLRRIEGQVRGVQRMLEEDRDCREIVQQLNAVHAAVGNATHLFVRAYAKDCLLAGSGAQNTSAVIDDLLDLIGRVKA
jgi:DNA-binding FrmR family transcriptional regulator